MKKKQVFCRWLPAKDRWFYLFVPRFFPLQNGAMNALPIFRNIWSLELFGLLLTLDNVEWERLVCKDGVILGLSRQRKHQYIIVLLSFREENKGILNEDEESINNTD